MNILHVISGDLWAGAEVMAYNLITELENIKGIKLTVIVMNRGVLYENLKKAGVDVVLISESKNSFVKSLYLITVVAKRNKANIIHSHRYRENIISWLVGKIFRASIVMTTVHGKPEYEANFKNKIIRKLDFILLKYSFDDVVVVSKDLKKYYVDEIGIREDKTNVIYNGININESISDISARNGSSRIVIGSVGRLVPVKNYLLLVNIAKELSKLYSNVEIRILGDGPLKQTLCETVNQLSIKGRVFFEEEVKDPSGFYKKLDIYINTSVHEGIPLSILEAMRAGKPVIAPERGGIPEIITDGNEGILIKSYEVHAFVYACRTLIENKNVREIMGKAGKKKVEETFSAKGMAANYHKEYTRLYKSV